MKVDINRTEIDMRIKSTTVSITEKQRKFIEKNKLSATKVFREAMFYLMDNDEDYKRYRVSTKHKMFEKGKLDRLKKDLRTKSQTIKTANNLEDKNG